MRLQQLLLLFAIVPLQVDAVSFKNADFELKLDSDWTRTVLIGADHLYFESKNRNVSLKIDSVRKTIRPENFVGEANRLIEAGIKREHNENRTGSVTVTDQTVSRLKDGVRAAYSGRDSTKRSFKWVGFIQEHKIVYLYFETPTRYENQLGSVVNDVLDGFRY